MHGKIERPHAAARVVGADNRIVPLEALRGLAALTVVFGHFAGAFMIPWPAGFDFLNFLTNGGAAVAVFFVLSGFVLALPSLEGADDTAVIRQGIKRWPRLMGPVLVATLISYACFRFGLYHHRELGDAVNSDWARTFGGTNVDGRFLPHLSNALWEGAVGTFFANAAHYNVALWTMYHELLGSYLVFALAFGLRRATWIGAAWLITLAIGFACFFDPRLLSFIVGTVIALVVTRTKRRVSIAVAVPLALAALYLYAYESPHGIHAPLAFVNDPSAWRFDRIGLHTVAGAILVTLLVTNDTFNVALNRPIFSLLGRMSFPLYLSHIPIMFTVSAITFLELHGSGFSDVSAKLLAAVTGVPALLGLTFLMMYADRHWLRFVNAVSAAMISRHRLPSPPGSQLPELRVTPSASRSWISAS